MGTFIVTDSTVINCKRKWQTLQVPLTYIQLRSLVLSGIRYHSSHWKRPDLRAAVQKAYVLCWGVRQPTTQPTPARRDVAWAWLHDKHSCGLTEAPEYREFNTKDLGRAKTQAVSRRLPTAAAQVGFLRVLRFPLPILIPPTALHPSSITRGWYNRPKLWPTWQVDSVSPHTKKLKKKLLRAWQACL
jgi:hypothetical protein